MALLSLLLDFSLKILNISEITLINLAFPVRCGELLRRSGDAIFISVLDLTLMLVRDRRELHDVDQ